MKGRRLVGFDRCQFLRGGVVGVAGAAELAVMPAKSALTVVDYPSTKLVSIADLTVNAPPDTGYSDASSPGDMVEVFSDVGATRAHACPEPTSRRNETFMIFVACNGAQGGDVINSGTNELILPTDALGVANRCRAMMRATVAWRIHPAGSF
jgi:hypothetical protein